MSSGILGYHLLTACGCKQTINCSKLPDREIKIAIWNKPERYVINPTKEELRASVFKIRRFEFMGMCEDGDYGVYREIIE